MSEPCHVLVSTSNPTVAPPRSGLHWVNTATDAHFLSIGTSSVADWVTFPAVQATETVIGLAEIATQAETNTGTDDERFVTPKKLTAWSGRYTHPNHSGEVTSTGDGAQVLDKTAISNQALTTPVAGDFFLYTDTSDSGNLKKGNLADILTGNPAGAYGHLSMVGNSTNTPLSEDSPDKVLGTTTLGLVNEFDDDGGVSNRLRYLGDNPQDFVVMGVANFDGQANARTGRIHIAVNGVVVASANMKTLLMSADNYPTTIFTMVNLENGDYVEIWVENTENNDDTIGEDLQLVVHSTAQGSVGPAGPAGPTGASGSPDQREFFAQNLLDPTNSSWAIEANAPLATDSNDPELFVRLHDDTVPEGSGESVVIPTGATNIVFDFKSRAETAPGVAKQVVPRLFYTKYADNVAVSAPTAGTDLTPIDIPTNENPQYDSQSLTLASEGLSVGDTVQFQITRNPGAAADDLVGDWALYYVLVSFT